MLGPAITLDATTEALVIGVGTLSGNKYSLCKHTHAILQYVEFYEDVKVEKLKLKKFGYFSYTV